MLEHTVQYFIENVLYSLRLHEYAVTRFYMKTKLLKFLIAYMITENNIRLLNILFGR